MKKIQRIIHAVLLIIMLSMTAMPPVLASAAPAQSGDYSPVQPAVGDTTVTLKINNQTGGVIARLEMKGQKKYTLTNVPQGFSEYQILKGKYNVSYKTVCGQTVKTKLVLTKNSTYYTYRNSWCARTEITFENKTSAAFDLTLTGPKVYTIRIPVGKSKFTIDEGLYRFSAVTACGVKHGRHTFSNQRITWVWKCK